MSIEPAAKEAVASNAIPALAAGTPIRLMVMREINSRTAQAGTRFRLRVDEPVFLNGVPIVPVGTTAWGEIVAVTKNGAVGKSGKLAARILYLDLASGPVPLRGEMKDQGSGNGAGVVLAIVGFGVFGLLTGGDSARLKAGDLFTAYVDTAAQTPSAIVNP
jgi:hypothetical protein